MSTKEYDIIIIGAGCAGMQMMRALLHHPMYSGQRILLLDDGKSIQQSKTWCFWFKPGLHPYQHLISKQWDQLSIGTRSIFQTKSIAPYIYGHINSVDFFDFHFSLIKQNPQIQYLEEQVLFTKKEAQGFYVSTNKHRYFAQHVFSSSWDHKMVAEQSRVYLQQQFYGWQIETEKEVFNEKAATLMDFRTAQHQGVSFIYTLPFSGNTALIEFTSFTDQPFDQQYFETTLKDFVEKNFNTSFRITKYEQAIIPMTDFGFKRFTNEEVIAIGTAAGMVKSTTGYAFNRILKDSQQLADQVLTGKPIFHFEKNRFHFYDRLLLQIIQKQPAEALFILETLFEKVPFNRVLQFLDEDTNLWQEAALFTQLPKKSFLLTIPDLWKSAPYNNIPATQP
ncbi:MAG: Lycopene cyclase [Bacteroidota bacterium]|jgi:lycopene beta-cyclase